MTYLGKIRSIALATAFGLGISVISSAAEDAPGVTADSVKVGSWIALTGPVAVYGVPIRAGADALINAVNDAGGVNGRKIEWLVEDSAYNPQQTIAIARKLITSDHILAALIPHGTAQTAATFPFAVTEHKLPMLLPYGGAMDWYQPTPTPGLLGLHVLYETQANALGRMAVQDGHKKILGVFGAAAAFENVVNNVEPGAKAIDASATVDKLAVKIGTTDYGPIARDIINQNPDAIVSIQLLQEVALLSKALRQAGSKIQIYTYAPNVANATIELGGEYVEGLKTASLTSSPFADTPAAQEYRDRLAKYFPDQKPDFVSYLGYGAAKVFVEALSQAKEPLTRESLIEGFHALKSYDSGVFPPVTFSADKPLGGHFLNPMTVKGGKWESAGESIDTDTFK
jgi:branched-chain amino acid transport system substrate-binding protein